MMEFAKDLVSNVGSTTADFAKMLGGNTAGIAKRVGSGSVKLAKNVGPKRGLLGLALVAAAVGSGIYLARYLRARAAEASKKDANGVRSKKMRKAESRAQHAAQMMH
jgi:hypothetical protein